VYELAGLEPGHVRHHQRWQCVGGDVERYAEEDVGRALIKLAGELIVCVCGLLIAQRISGASYKEGQQEPSRVQSSIENDIVAAGREGRILNPERFVK
jgi:hypothetical protein